MQKITVKELIDFRRKSDKSKKSFAFKLKNREAKVKIDNEEGGGDYWITSTSCIYNVFKQNNLSLYDTKVEELKVKFGSTEDKRTKSMHQRNIDILSNFKEFDLGGLRPSNDLKYEKVPKSQKILSANNFPLYVNPSLLFTYEKNGKQELGALWLIPKLEGYKKPELGMFCEVLYRLLVKNYSHKYQISTDHCIAIDTYNAQKVVYTNLINKDVPFLIDKTLQEIIAL